jgi:hypothetical protein
LFIVLSNGFEALDGFGAAKDTVTARDAAAGLYGLLADTKRPRLMHHFRAKQLS